MIRKKEFILLFIQNIKTNAETTTLNLDVVCHAKHKINPIPSVKENLKMEVSNGAGKESRKLVTFFWD